MCPFSLDAGQSQSSTPSIPLPVASPSVVQSQPPVKPQPTIQSGPAVQATTGLAPLVPPRSTSKAVDLPLSESPKASGSTDTGRAVRVKILQAHPSLTWSNEPMRMEEREVKGGKGKEYFVTMKGTFGDKNTDILLGTRKVLSTQEKVPAPFFFTVLVAGVSTTVKLRLINELGELKTSHVEVIISDYVARVKSMSYGNPFKFSGSLGYSMITYKEGTTTNISMSGLTVKGGVLYQYIPDRWDLGLSFYLTALPLSSNSGNTLRFLGVNYRVGYTFSSIPKPWSLALMFGGYYTTMFVSSPTFGFTNLSGPQLFPVWKYQLNPKSLLSFYAKYSLIMAGLSVFSLSQGEFAAGASYVGLLENKRSFTAGIDLANLSLKIGSVPVSSSSLSLSVGYAW